MDNSAQTNAEIIRQRWALGPERRSLLASDSHAHFGKTWAEFMEGSGLTKFATAVNLVKFLDALEAKNRMQYSPDSISTTIDP